MTIFLQLVICTAQVAHARHYSSQPATHTDIVIILLESLIIHEAKTKENHKRDGFGNVIKPLHKLAKLSPSFSPE